MRTTHRKRRGSRCSIRRYEFLYPSIEKEPARHVPIAYGFADGANVSKLQTIGRRQEPFYAFVTYPAAKRAYIRSLISPVEAEARSEEHTSELQSLMRISYAVFCLKKKRHSNKHKAHLSRHILLQ